VAILLGGGQSDRTYVQRVGRVLRPSPGKEALIYELIVQGCGDDLKVERRRRALAGP
jgi:superfamily II DNA or RNA helicase